MLLQGMPRAWVDEVTNEQLTSEFLDPSATVEDRLVVYDQAAGTLRTEAMRQAAMLQAIERALARPRFADACPLVIEAECDDNVRVLYMQSALAVRAFAHASEGRLPEAFLLSTEALRAYLDLAATARRVLSMVVAGIVIKRALAALELLVHLAARLEASPDSWRAPRDALRAQLAAWSSLDVQRSVRGEYVVVRDAFERVHAHLCDRMSALAFDPRATSATFDAYYRPLHDYAGDPSRPAPADPTRYGDPGWWERNSIGERLSSRLLGNHEPGVRQLHQLDADLRARARALQQTLPPD